MNCLEFERVLDGGALDALSAEAHAHVGSCARCARALARARSLELGLTRAFSREHGAPVTGLAAGDALPSGFADRVMARVAATEARGVHRAVLADALPWWVRAAAEPSVVLAAAVAALMVWKGNALIALARALTQAQPLPLPAPPAELVAVAHAVSRLLVPGPQVHWSVAAGVLLGLTPVLGLVAWLLWRMGERLVLPAGAHRR